MDRIIKHLLEDFLLTQELAPEGQTEDFAKFVNYSIISREYTKMFDIEDVTVGAGDDTGVDGIAIIVNGQLVGSIEEIDFLLENNNYLEATYVFVQAKSSSSFDSSEMNNFAFGVKDFFAEEPKLRRNLDIQDCAEVSDYLFSKASQFRENPTCKLFFVTTGTWNEDDQNLQAAVETTERDLTATNLFCRVSYAPYGANEIARAYRQTKSSISASFVFSDKVTLPDLPGITESYYGILPFNEFRKLLVDENDNLRNIFYDNVRDFQGQSNPVNRKISETLGSEQPEFFTVLNNGVTIVASSLKASGNKFTITDYQIVNGCQTSNILFNHLNSPGIQKLVVPLKLIVTDDDDVKNRITIATNSQTAIKREQLQAMTDFQKNLEHYYNTIQGEGRLYYERRSGQYQSDSSVIKARIITIQTQIKAFSSMFLENPHRVTSYFGSIVKQNIENENPTIFNPQHKFIPYYTAGLAYYRLDSLFRSRAIDTRYRKIKFFLLMLFSKLVASKFPQTHMSSERKTSKHCEPIVEILNDRDRMLSFFSKAIAIWEQTDIDVDDKQLLKQASTTEKLIETYELMLEKSI